ncbi:MAG: chorismate lyase [Perlucidibaca sp.]
MTVTISPWPHPRRWLASRRRWLQPPPDSVRSWLDEPGSLTARLSTLARGDFRVQVLHEGWARPTREECRHLGLGNHEYAWVREVILLGCGQPWVRARSILPRSSLVGVGRRLTRLGNRSLGGLLFRDPALIRGDIACARLNLDGAGTWARRSRLVLHDHPVLVAEAFLPALLSHAAAGTRP